MNNERRTMNTNNARFPRASSFIVRRSSFPTAFTLTELLVVIGLVVLLLTISLPAISFITGSRSVEGAENVIGAMLARAREQAIADQKPAGVFFFISPDNDRVSMALVEQFYDATTNSNRPSTEGAGDPDVSSVDVYLDMVPDSEVVVLPKGIGAELVDDGAINTAVTPYQRYDDGYIGYNNKNVAPTAPVTPISTINTYINYGGVVLFDANGRISRLHYGFKTYTRATGTPAWTDIGQVLFHKDRNIDIAPKPFNSGGSDYDVVPWMIYNTAQTSPPVPSAPPSSIGIALFDREKFKTQFNSATPASDLNWQLGTGATANTNTYKTNGTSDEFAKDNWLDQNASPVMINRYNGTLLKTE